LTAKVDTKNVRSVKRPYFVWKAAKTTHKMGLRGEEVFGGKRWEI